MSKTCETCGHEGSVWGVCESCHSKGNWQPTIATLQADNARLREGIATAITRLDANRHARTTQGYIADQLTELLSEGVSKG